MRRDGEKEKEGERDTCFRLVGLYNGVHGRKRKTRPHLIMKELLVR